MRTALLIAAAFLGLISTAQAQVVHCQQFGGNMMCSDGTIIYGLRSHSPEQSGEFAFGQGLAAGRSALESHSRQQLLNQQTEQLKLQNQLRQRQLNTTRQSATVSPGCTTPGPACSDMVQRQNNEVVQRKGAPPGCRSTGPNTFSCD